MMTNVMGANGASGELVLRCYEALNREHGQLRGCSAQILRDHRNRIERALAALEVRSARRRRNEDVAELPINHSWSAP
jgi:hypothetical protein